MNIEVINTNLICDYCKRQDNYGDGHSCPLWYNNEVCQDAEDFIGKELIEITND